MASVELGRQVAPERAKNRVKTMSQAMTVGILVAAATLASACEAPQKTGIKITPTDLVTPVPQDLSRYTAHCIVIPKGEKPILDHAKFKCGPDGKPVGVFPSIPNKNVTPASNATDTIK